MQGTMTHHSPFQGSGRRMEPFARHGASIQPMATGDLNFSSSPSAISPDPTFRSPDRLSEQAESLADRCSLQHDLHHQRPTCP